MLKRQSFFDLPSGRMTPPSLVFCNVVLTILGPLPFPLKVKVLF